MSSPVQIVLNAQDYVRIADPGRGGGSKDFFADRDIAFARHRDLLRNQLLDLSRNSEGGGQDDLLYARVELQADAWAKSHRPTKALFSSSSIGPTFGGPLGSLVVEIPRAAIQKVVAAVESAEPETRWKVDKNGKPFTQPSRARSEVGAIQSIRSYSAADRRNFSIEQAVEWLSDARTGASYYVETFVSMRSANERADPRMKDRAVRAIEKFSKDLAALALPVQITQLSENWITASLFIVTLDERVARNKTLAMPIHTALLEFLDRQPIVRSIILPPVLQAARVTGDAAEHISVPAPLNADEAYPVVGIVDSGVAALDDVGAWSAGGADMAFGAGQDTDHGTFIAGLVCGADALNSHSLFQEEKCRFYDLGLHPTTEGAYSMFYPRGFVDFLEQLDAEIPAAKKSGARVFNMSLSVTSPVSDATYSIFANLLDEISDRHDIIFVLPAGNLDSAQARDEWPKKSSAVLEMLAGFSHAGQDRIFQPGDSIRSLVVGALNPPDEIGNCTPARYTRRGPGPSLGAKPDICHVGGKLDVNSGLCSVSSSGDVLHSCGTSFVAPLAAKTMAAINHLVAGDVSREALLALAIHHAEIPVALQDRRFKKFIRDFVGAGLPRTAAQTLVNGENEITLVFTGVLTKGQELRFSFAWPKSLVNDQGGCSGDVKVTLVHRPPIDRDHAGEFVRVNLDAFLRQEVIDIETGEASFVGRLKQDSPSGLEKELIKHGAKWWPVKRSYANLEDVGNSSQWRLVVESLSRSEFEFPTEGVPFTVLLTISDGLGLPIFNEMRQQLQFAGANISDIRATVRPRIANS